MKKFIFISTEAQTAEAVSDWLNETYSLFQESPTSVKFDDPYYKVIAESYLKLGFNYTYEALSIDLAVRSFVSGLLWKDKEKK